MIVFDHLLCLTLINCSVFACFDYLLHAGLLLLQVPKSAAFASSCLHVGVAVALLSEGLTAVFTLKGLRSAMDANVIEYIANFEELTIADGAYEDLIWTASEIIVSEYFDISSFQVFSTGFDLGVLCELSGWHWHQLFSNGTIGLQTDFF